MEENKNLQPELSPEDRLDQLLAEFLAAPDMDVPTPPAEEIKDDLSVEESTLSDEEISLPVEEVSVSVEEAPLPIEEAHLAEPLQVEEAALDPDDGPDILPILEMENDMGPMSTPLSDPEPETAAEFVSEPEPISEPDTVPAEDLTIGESLAPATEAEEIGVDEQALEAAGLTTVEAAPAEADESSDQDEPAPSTASIPVLINTAQDNPETEEPEEMAMNTTENNTDETLQEEQEEYIPAIKIRPRKKGAYGFFSIPHMAAVVIWLAIIVFVGVGLGNIIWAYASDMLAFGRESRSVTITITETDDLEDVCQKLKATGLIKYPGLFSIYADLSDAMEDIRPGTYTLNTIYDYMALVKAMSGYASRVTVKVVIPEGYTCEQIFRLLESQGVCSAAELEAAAANAELGDYWFLEGVDRSAENCLEGYLFPDTYEFYLNHDATSVLQKFLNNFNKRFNDTMKENLVTLNETLSEMMRQNGLSEEYIAQHQMTIREVVIIASMIEKESADTSEGYTVASVIYNRLTNPYAYPYLQIDATLVYITGNNNLTAADKAIDSPYNTYKYAGLIPGPISNPSRASLDAALDPDSTPYYYYALNKQTGMHKFSETLAEHNEFLNNQNQNNEDEANG